LDVDPNASIRTELLGQIMAAQFAIDTAIAELTRSGADPAMLAQAQSQLAAIGDLRQQLGSASGSALANMRSEIVAAATAATAVAGLAMGSAANAAAGNATLTPAQRARATIEAVGHDLFESRVLDPYLEFASPEDEAAYRKREQERDAAYDREKAKNSTDGDRKAFAIMESQMADAKTHGADRAPEFGQMEEALRQVSSDVQPQAGHSGHESVKASPPSASVSLGGDGDLNDVMAALKSAGVEAGGDHAPDSGHGVAKIAATPNRGSGRG
jgi:hypothetical protein